MAPTRKPKHNQKSKTMKRLMKPTINVAGAFNGTNIEIRRSDERGEYLSPEQIKRSYTRMMDELIGIRDFLQREIENTAGINSGSYQNVIRLKDDLESTLIDAGCTIDHLIKKTGGDDV